MNVFLNQILYYVFQYLNEVFQPIVTFSPKRDATGKNLICLQGKVL